MSRTDAAVTVIGAGFGMIGAVALSVFVWLRLCERVSSRRP